MAFGAGRYVDYRTSLAALGTVLKYLGLTPLFPAATALYSGSSAKAHEFTRGMKRVSLIGRPPVGWPAEVGASPPKPLSRPGATLTWLRTPASDRRTPTWGCPSVTGAGLWPAEPHDFSRGRSQCPPVHRRWSRRTPENVGTIPGNLEDSLRQALFQVVAIVTTTGYASMDFNTWGESAQTTLLVAMFLGGSAGSAAGSIKIVRWLLIYRTTKREIFSTVHPESVRVVRYAGDPVDDDTLRGIMVFVLVFVMLFAASVVLIFLDSHRTPGLSLSALEATSATVATLGNIGPGVGVVGPMNNFEPFSDAAKLYMVFLMWIGRLEIVTVIVVLSPSFWRR